MRGRPLTVHRAVEEVVQELGRLGAPSWNVIVSTNLAIRNDGLPYSNQRAPDDPGAAVYFRFRDEDESRRKVLACDRYDRVEHNLWAIRKHVEAVRGIERWGVASLERMFAGFEGIPEHAGGEPWWRVLGMEDRPASRAELERAFRRRAQQVHPDHGGTDAQIHAVLEARRQGLVALGITA